MKIIVSIVIALFIIAFLLNFMCLIREFFNYGEWIPNAIVLWGLLVMMLIFYITENL